MYLSRLHLDPGAGATPQTDRLLRSPYLLHQAVFAAFDPRERGQGGVLYRREPELREGRVVILVQSRLAPDWQRGFARSLAAGEPPEVRPLSLRRRRGQWFRFRLRANPTRRTREGKRRSILSGLGQGEHRDPPYYNAVLAQLAAGEEPNPPPARIREYVLDRWLRRQLHGAVADLEFQITDEDLLEDDKPGNIASGSDPRPAHQLQFKSVRYDGILQVAEPDRLHGRVVCGIGSGKAFGFGLLSLAPVR
ncbi:MAG: type I-E CRISPR-associated protein Cas6/Cse3/CasE [Armatimonadetes bacterium]|nr:type I-E CRISPR-associated protein Cas6/Cse3/CasE [Armatimonadota bacterium]